MLLPAMALAAATLAAPLTNGTRSTCPSAYGPGRHSIRMQIPDADDPEFIWEREFTVYVAEEMPLARCLAACLGDQKCDAVAVEWVEVRAWPAPAQMPWRSDKVRCGLRGGVDLGSCSRDSTRASSTIAIVS